MSSFKYKPDKLKYVSHISTLDELHKKRVDDFTNMYATVEKKKEFLKKYREDLFVVENKNKSLYSFEDIKKKASLKDNIEKLEREIQNIEQKNDEIDYYSKTSDILFEYFDIVDTSQYNTQPEHGKNMEKEKKSEEQIMSNSLSVEISDKLIELNVKSQQNKKIKKPTRKRMKNIEQKSQHNILSYFMQSTTETKEGVELVDKKEIEIEVKTKDIAKKEKKKELVIESDDEYESISVDNSSSQPTIERVVANRATLKDEYMTILDKAYVANKTKRYTIRMCSNCNEEKTLIQSEGIYVCQQCGEIEHIIIESEVPNHKDASNEKPRYPYKRQNHAIEWLNQFQGKESTEIPDEIHDQIVNELKKQRIYNTVKKLQYKKIRPIIKQILKKLRLQGYYEHLPYIISKITETAPPVLTREIEEKLKTMFKRTQGPFTKYCPPQRINFLNYSYVFNKLFRILNNEEFADRFPLLKSREKLREQDSIWKNICRDLAWPFHPSI